MDKQIIVLFFAIKILGIYGQISSHPVVIGRLGKSAVLSCHSNGIPLRLCFWEQKQSDKLIATFDLTSSPGGSGDYTFYGDVLEKGQCAIKIKEVRLVDLQRWKCTMVSRDNTTNVFRGTVLLQGAETLEEPSVSFESLGTTIKPSRSESRKFNSGFVRPIITADDGGLIPSDSGTASFQNTAPVQEVEVQSAGLYITPKRKDRKLVIL